MSKNKNILIPKLRFPEFENFREWEEKKLGKCLIKNTLKNKKQKYSLVQSVSNRFGFINQNDYFENRRVASKDTSNYYVIRKGYFAYNPSRINVGSLAYKKDDKTSIISPLYVSFKANNNFVEDDFLLNWFISENFTKQLIFEGGVRNTLNYKNLIQVNILLPSPQEQQKIASCLSSLDELIEAHSQKLELLKQHKKGLMQNLFPQEGEKVPKLRFKEFENCGEWEEKSISSIAKISTGGTPNSTVSKYWGGNIPWMNSGELNLKKVYSVKNFITDLGLRESSTKKIPVLCVLIGLAGQGKTRGTAAINYIELCTNQSIAAIHPNPKKFVSEFLYFKIDSMYKTLRRLSTGQGGRGGLNLSIIREIKIHIPSLPEQQKIASCLSSLDDLITAQIEKIKQLKQHKKGLMQGLFPEIDN